VFGNVAQTSEDAAYLARHVGLKSGVPLPSPALTVNRLCGSGFQAVVSAAYEVYFLCFFDDVTIDLKLFPLPSLFTITTVRFSKERLPSRFVEELRA